MRAVLLTGHGGYDQLELRDDVPVPVPGPQDVLIRVGAAGVNNTDINTRIGWYSKAVAEATDAGADACGRIVAVGYDVNPARIGQRVLIMPNLAGEGRYDIRYFGSEVDGAFADYACVPDANAFAVNTSLSDADLASFPCAYATAENILTRIGLTSGERVLVAGASGGVGSAAVQLAKRRGATVWAMAGADKVSAVSNLGADHVISREADLERLFGKQHFDAVVDVVGGTQFAAMLNVLKSGGRYGVSGAIAGPIVDLDLRTLYLKDLKLIGCTVLEPYVFANLVGYIERGEIKPLVAATFPLSDIVAAQQAFLAKRHVGKIVLRL
jgi:NADPH:quinone reductase-like Zn-dependent oxidoreductase